MELIDLAAEADPARLPRQWVGCVAGGAGGAGWCLWDFAQGELGG